MQMTYGGVAVENAAPTAITRADKYRFIEGVRGLAALQVVALHYFSAFFPAFARVSQTPVMNWEHGRLATSFFFVINGNVAVFVFFVMSGFVLAQSFANSLDSAQPVVRIALKRYLRLFLPVACSILFAAVLVASAPNATNELTSTINNHWVATLYQSPPHLWAIAKEALVNSLILGYRGGSIFDDVKQLAGILPPLTSSFNAPTWTLHAELWGSLLVLLTAWVHRHAPRHVYLLFILASLFTTGTSHFTLFTIGFVAFTHRDRILNRTGLARTIVGALCIASAIGMSSAWPMPFFSVIVRVSGAFTLLHADYGIRLQNEIVAVLLMAGIVSLPRVRSSLSTRAACWLGKISFSLYLTHFPILFTSTMLMFGVARDHMSYVGAVAVSAFIGIGLSVAVATVFEAWVDRPSINLSRWIASRWLRAADREAGAADSYSSAP